MTNLPATRRDPIVHAPPEATLGPAMLALNDRQRNFVVALLETGSANHTEAAAMAGYSGDRATLQVTGHRLAHDDRVLEAIREEAHRRMRSSAILASSALVEIISNREGEETKDRLKAIDMLLNRVGLHGTTEHKTTVTHTMDEKQMVARIKALAEGLGLDAKKLLGSAGVVIDAEFREVPAEETSGDGSEGLEDLL